MTPGSTVTEWPNRIRHDLRAVHLHQALDIRISRESLFGTGLLFVARAGIANASGVATDLACLETQLNRTAEHGRDRIAQLQLSQGTLNVRVRRLAANQVFEVDTPNLAFTLRQPGEYRISVDPDGNATDIFVRKGQGEVYGEGAAYAIDSRQPYRFAGTGLREYQYIDAPRADEFSALRRHDDAFFVKLAYQFRR